MSVRPSPLHVSTAIAILVFDWLVLAINLTTHVHHFAYADAFGACGAALTVALIEQAHDTSLVRAIVLGAIAGAIVAVPLPLLGTAVSLVFLTWSVAAHAQSQRPR